MKDRSDKSGVKPDLGARLLAHVMTSSVQESLKFAGEHVLRQVVIAAVAGPVAAVLAGATKVVAQELFDKTKKLETKLDHLIAEPLESASTRLAEILEAEFDTEDEFDECERRLAHVDDNLQKAHIYAQQQDSESLTLIRFYQAITAALMKGGKPFVDLYAHELENQAQGMREKAEESRAWARSMDAEIEKRSRIIQRLDDSVFLDERQSSRLAGLHSMVAASVIERQDELLSRAKDATSMASAIEEFCVLVRQLRIARIQVLRSKKVVRRR